MNVNYRKHILTFSVPAFLTALLLPCATYAHCDSLDGPVVASAKAAFQKGDVTPVLKWVTKAGENEVREAFTLAVKVRSQGDDSQRLAEMYFFETLVRVHRAGEGLPYTGLKPAGAIESVLVAADKALQEGSVDELAKTLATGAQDAIRARFSRALEKKKHAEETVEAGRAYVETYTDYMHFVEAVHSLAATHANQHHQTPETAAKHD
jgi:Family of unknown function (DUF6448)